jgi:putative transcriptional regulator
LIKCNLSKLMGDRRLTSTEVASKTGINRGTLRRLYHETAQRVDLDVLDKLCEYFDCEPGDILSRER